MGTELKVLKELPADAVATAQYEVMWNALRQKATDQTRSLMAQMYQQVLEYYNMTLQAMPLHTLSRKFNKLWTAEMTRLGLPPISISRMLAAAQASETMPIVVTLTPDAAYMLLPHAACGTYVAIAERDAELPESQRERLNDYVDFIRGKAAGPALRGNGLKLAYAPFGEE